MNLALFDFDGTITDSDCFSGFLRVAVSPVRKALGAPVLLPVLVAYRAGYVRAPVARPIAVRLAFAGRRVEALRAQGERFAATEIPRRVRPEARRRIEWHQQQGDRVVVVSASLDVYLRPWCATLGLDLICSCLEEQDGRFTGRYLGGDCSGVEKLRRVREAYDLGAHDAIYAYGDTVEDYAMLEIADHRYFRWRELDHWPPTGSSAHPGVRSERR